ncbi:hypothetical protein [Herpetosiphon llansteffanensis]|uniref:hypothetical protein n=1 Tax=Herpetosiphon llansteffanensis TaxID=2094568 RepID=UPI000D7D047B|nr:hypothetical protein [Herpetosiphon llansteffanensis]
MSAVVELNRAELVTICAVVSAATIMGVEPAANSGAHAQLMQQGEASLRQRNLAQSDHDGMLMIARDTLALVATCAYPQRSLILHHVPSNGSLLQAFGHKHADSVVFHEVLNPDAQRLQALGSLQELANQSLDWCGYAGVAQTPLRFHIQSTVLAEARSLIEGSEEQAALQALRDSGVSADAANLFIAMLSQHHTTTIFNAVVYQGQQVLSREYTLLQAGDQALLMTQTNIEQDLYQLETTSRERLASLLLQSLA